MDVCICAQILYKVTFKIIKHKTIMMKCRLAVVKNEAWEEGGMIKG